MRLSQPCSWSYSLTHSTSMILRVITSAETSRLADWHFAASDLLSCLIWLHSCFFKCARWLSRWTLCWLAVRSEKAENRKWLTSSSKDEIENPKTSRKPLGQPLQRKLICISPRPNVNGALKIGLSCEWHSPSFFTFRHSSDGTWPDRSVGRAKEVAGNHEYSNLLSDTTVWQFQWVKRDEMS